MERKAGEGRRPGFSLPARPLFLCLGFQHLQAAAGLGLMLSTTVESTAPCRLSQAPPSARAPPAKETSSLDLSEAPRTLPCPHPYLTTFFRNWPA